MFYTTWGRTGEEKRTHVYQQNDNKRKKDDTKQYRIYMENLKCG